MRACWIENPKEPLLEYVFENGEWRWRGTLLAKPGQADRAARRIRVAYEEVSKYSLEGPITRLTIVSNRHIEIEAGGEEFVLDDRGGFTLMREK